MNKTKSIHFIGIKGVGMTALAVLAKEAGLRVTGSDLSEDFITSEILKEAGIEVFEGFNEGNVRKCDLVITTGAHGGLSNKEALTAKNMGIPVITQGEAVGMFMRGRIFDRDFEGISIAGSHGKTTTTAMIATVLKGAGYDPSYVIGTGKISSLGFPGHYGKGKFFVAEADEYATEPNLDKKAKFLWQFPKVQVFTNIEMDHPDVYPSLESLRQTFVAFLNNLSSDGLLVANGDDIEIKKILPYFSGRKVTYGFGKNNDFYLERINIEPEKMFFQVKSKDMLLGDFSISAPAEHNALNALAAIAVSLELGVSIEKIRSSLSTFAGTKRRQEFVGKTESGAYIFDDYAHHPTEIKATIASFKKRFPNKKLLCIFQPHTYSRTKSLFNEFAHAFSETDETIILDIFASQREDKDETISSLILTNEMKKYSKKVVYLPTISRVVEYLTLEEKGRDWLIITMGAGDVYKIGDLIKDKE